MVKKLLIAILMVISLNTFAFAIKPCNGLAGYKLGEEIKLENVSFIEETLELKYYKVNIIKPFMEFNSCVLGITPNTNVIGSIEIISEGKRKGSEYLEKVKNVVESHYQISENDKKDSISLFDDGINYKFPNSRTMRIHLSTSLFSGDYKLYLKIEDEMILKKGKEETKQNTIKNTDTSGLE